jgi:hypothetical protein
LPWAANNGAFLRRRVGPGGIGHRRTSRGLGIPAAERTAHDRAIPPAQARPPRTRPPTQRPPTPPPLAVRLAPLRKPATRNGWTFGSNMPPTSHYSRRNPCGSGRPNCCYSTRPRLLARRARRMNDRSRPAGACEGQGVPHVSGSIRRRTGCPGVGLSEISTLLAPLVARVRRPSSVVLRSTKPNARGRDIGRGAMRPDRDRSRPGSFCTRTRARAQLPRLHG